MEKIDISNGEVRSKIVADELIKFKKLIEEHEKLLRAIGGL